MKSSCFLEKNVIYYKEQTQPMADRRSIVCLTIQDMNASPAVKNLPMMTISWYAPNAALPITGTATKKRADV